MTDSWPGLKKLAGSTTTLAFHLLTMAPTQQHQPLGSGGTGNKSKDLAQVTALLTEGAKKKKVNWPPVRCDGWAQFQHSICAEQEIKKLRLSLPTSHTSRLRACCLQFANTLLFPQSLQSILHMPEHKQLLQEQLCVYTQMQTVQVCLLKEYILAIKFLEAWNQDFTCNKLQLPSELHIINLWLVTH